MNSQRTLHKLYRNRKMISLPNEYFVHQRLLSQYEIKMVILNNDNIEGKGVEV